MELTYENTSKTISLEHGDIHYHDVGQGPCLLLIHGSGPGVTGWANYQGNLEFFAAKFRCLVIDLPGYGKSDPIAGEPVSGCVTACLNFLKALEISSVHLIGNSLGGIVASHIAATEQDLVKSFTTIGGIGLNIFTAFPGEGLNLLTAFTEEPNKKTITAWLKSMVYDPSIVTEELIESRFIQATEPKTLETTKQIYAREAIQAIADTRRQFATKTIEHLPNITAPTLITWGRDDRVSPMDICLIPMRIIPNCELHIFPKCGHWAMIECKEQFESLVMSFLLQHESFM